MNYLHVQADNPWYSYYIIIFANINDLRNCNSSSVDLGQTVPRGAVWSSVFSRIENQEGFLMKSQHYSEVLIFSLYCLYKKYPPSFLKLVLFQQLGESPFPQPRINTACLCLHCLTKKLPKHISRQQKQITFVVISALRVRKCIILVFYINDSKLENKVVHLLK